MQSIIDKLQTPQSFVQSVQELVIALQVIQVVEFSSGGKKLERFLHKNYQTYPKKIIEF